MSWNAEQMVPYMWRQPSLICAFMLGESGSMDDWYPTRQLADYLHLTPQGGVGVETETNCYHCCVDSRLERNTTFPCLDTAKRRSERGRFVRLSGRVNCEAEFHSFDSTHRYKSVCSSTLNMAKLSRERMSQRRKLEKKHQYMTK